MARAAPIIVTDEPIYLSMSLNSKAVVNEVSMKGAWQGGGPQIQMQFIKGRKPGVFSVLMFLLLAAFFLVFGVGLLMIVATLVVLLLPWLWWKKRQLLQKVQAAQAHYQSGAQNHSSADYGRGVVIEGEVMVKEKTTAPTGSLPDQ